MAKVGLVIPTRNRAGMLPFVLHTVLAQTYRPARILVVDNGSTDDTRAVVDGFRGAGVEYHYYPWWRATYDGSCARAHGYRLLASMDFVCSIDDDDYIPPDYLAKLVKAFESNPKAAVAYPSVLTFGDDSGYVHARPFDLRRLRRAHWIISGSMIRTDALRSIGGWRGHTGLRPEDIDTWWAIADAGWKFVAVPRALYYYRQKPDSASKRWDQIHHDKRPIISLIVVLTIHRRPQSFLHQLELIHSQTVRPQQIWAVVNDPSEDTRWMVHHAKLDQVFFCYPNSGFYGRFAICALPQSEWVCLLDDDCLPGAEWFEQCHVISRERGDAILGPWGMRFKPPATYGLSFTRPTELVEVDHVGHAYWMRPEWLALLFREKLFTGVAGDDIELCARAKRLAGIRSFVTPYPPDCPAKWGDTDDQRYGNMPQAQWHRYGYSQERESVIEAEVAKGWELIQCQE